MDAIITAGGIPEPGDPLYPYTQGENKSLLDVAGKPMIQWVLDALNEAQLVDSIIIVGLPETVRLSSSKIQAYLPNEGTMLHNLRAGMHKVLEMNPKAHHALTVSSDIPAITGEMVDWVIRTTQESDLDLYYNVITREVMEARFPESRRSYIHLRGMDVCGGDMNVIRTMTVTGNDELWQKIIAARKSALKQASLLGWDTLLLLLLRRISIDKGVEMATRRLNITGKVLICPYAEVGMDVDKPHQLEMLRADLAQRVSSI